ncbi:TPA: DUF1367 family protein [Salmonella enterica subsp. enterica serovar Reading]|nr:DUF1367 family protein [Salmonella enterica]EBW4259462.1 hypothetical protein [Salmonella enterica subsp. enterica serovar Reading]EAT4127126.1 DUF1367 family protein [Salmonella enterica]EAT7977914.1 DUF1367 family protein [Salmonella enterica]EAT9908927.1 DUF1367 family protein [Salmonella enterica]
MAHELQLIKQSSGILIPATPETSDILQSKIKLGAVLVAEFRQVRNPAFHRRFFALLNLGFEYWEPTGGAISANERKLVNGYAKFLAAYGGNESALLDAAEQYLEQIANRRVTNGIKPLKHWIDLTQRAVNDICRETELAEGLGCISCGTKTAFAWHAGHYRSTAAAGHLRFTRFNIHLQCDVCNVYKSGNIEAYRAALVERYGEAAVLALENNNTPHRWTVEELKEIRLAALADLRALKKLEAA